MAAVSYAWRGRLLRGTYYLLFGLACGGLATAVQLALNAYFDWQKRIDDTESILVGVIAVILGWAVSPFALRLARLHSACLWLGGLGCGACLLSAAYWFARDAATNGWESLEYFVFCILSLAGAILAAIICLCGVLGRRLLRTAQDNANRL